MCVLSFWFAVVSLRWVLWSVVVAESCVWVWVCCVVVGLYQGFCCVGNDVFQGLEGCVYGVVCNGYCGLSVGDGICVYQLYCL